ncbi:HigA family addiction module antitoxin [Alloalcanivorax mobilis]|uniref:HigA family addiction module antitoxin n=1 Tax=Alloalcanivorax mobilis TaxID=2019569 RepID=UPI000C7879EB|nr:HigA family addiction module antitoxin [Alloalcanivorax mobilis]
MANVLRAPAHPATSVGVMLEEEFLEPLGITQDGLAKAMGVTSETVKELCSNRRRVTVETATLLAEVLGTTPAFWLNLQRLNDGHGG